MTEVMTKREEIEDALNGAEDAIENAINIEAENEGSSCTGVSQLIGQAFDAIEQARQLLSESEYDDSEDDESEI